MKKRYRARPLGRSFLLASAISLFCAPSYAELQWGKPSYIVVAADAPERDQFAAREFQRIYKLRTNVELPISNENRGHGVYIGRAALNIEPKGTEGTLSGGSRYKRTYEKWEGYVERSLNVDFDTMRSDDFVYWLCGWTGPFAIFIAGATPGATLEAVYDFCEKNLGMSRNPDKNAVVRLASFNGWSMSNFVQRPDAAIRRLKAGLQLQLPSFAVQPLNDSRNRNHNDQK